MSIILQNIENKIHSLYEKVGIATLYNKQHATEEYFQRICRLSTRLEEDLSYFKLKGEDISKDARDKLQHLKKLACNL